MKLKRNEFDVVTKSGGGGTPPPGSKPPRGWQPWPDDDSSSSSGENSGSIQPNAPVIKKKEKTPGEPGKEGSSGKGEESKNKGEPRKGGSSGGEAGGEPGGEPGKGDSGGGSGKEEGGSVTAGVTSITSVNTTGRGPGGMLTPEESRILQDALGVPYEAPPSEKEIKETIRKNQPLIKKQGSKNAGSGKGTHVRLLPDAIAKLVNPIVDWKALLKKYVGRILGDEREPVMPNRRFVSSGDYVYGSRKAKTKLKTCVIAVDVSGSIGFKELLIMINEVKGIAATKRLQNFEIVYFDHGIQHVQKLTDKQVASYKPTAVGGGGTSFKEPLEYMERLSKKGDLDLAVFMTDGYADLRLPVPRFKDKFVWMILDNPSFEAPFGSKVVHVEVEGGK